MSLKASTGTTIKLAPVVHYGELNSYVILICRFLTEKSSNAGSKSLYAPLFRLWVKPAVISYSDGTYDRFTGGYDYSC